MHCINSLSAREICCSNFSQLIFFLFQIPASVISSVGTINYQQHQLFVVSKSVNASDPLVQSIPVVVATSASTVNAQNIFSVPSSVSDGNVNTKMIQQTNNVQPPRLHPKKRKFDLSELEDDHSQTTASLMASNVCNNPVTISVPQSSATSTTLIYQKTSPTNHGHNGNGSHQTATSANYTSYNPSIMTQVVKNTGEAQQVIRKQFTNYR